MPTESDEGSTSTSSGWRRRLGSLTRRKNVDLAPLNHSQSHANPQLAKKLSAFDLVALGVGSTIGAGVYILIGTVAREQTGPGIVFSFLIGGIAAAISALCYAELACRCPSAGSAYHYSYLCVGEGIAWLIGWALLLEYTLGSAAVARGVSPNLALFLGGEDKLPAILARQTLFGIVVDPCAAIFVCTVASLLCLGIKESSSVQTIVTSVNVAAMIFIILAGLYIGCTTGWVGYDIPNGYFPFGVNGIFGASATLFYSYVGFDAVASTAEEVMNPKLDLPIGIGLSLAICCFLYMVVSAVIVGLVPYFLLNRDTPISSAFASYGMDWAAYIVATGAITSLCSGLIGGILPQPRLLMAMARDGLLPSFFSDINQRTKVPVKSTLVTGVAAALLSFSMDIEQLAGMVSVGTLLAFTSVAISVLILRYIPAKEVEIPPSILDFVHSASIISNANTQEILMDKPKDGFSCDGSQPLLGNRKGLVGHSPLRKVTEDIQRKWKIAAWCIALLCIGSLALASAVSAEGLHRTVRFILFGAGGILLCSSLIWLCSVDQDGTCNSFGNPGGFVCPFVPFLPATCILVNTYLLINLGAGTWIRVSIWLAVGVVVYAFYGRTHSLLVDKSYLQIAQTDEKVNVL